MKKHSVTIRGHRTSFSIEPAFMAELRRIARDGGRSLAQIITEIDGGRIEGQNLSSAIRLFVLEDLKRARSPSA